MRRRWLGLGMAIAAGALVMGAAASPTPLAREVLLLYYGPDGRELRGFTEQRAIETVLNHLGLVVRYHNLLNGLPDSDLSARARGVVAYIDGDATPGARAYARWLSQRIAAGQRVVLLGGLGMLQDAQTGAPTPDDYWQPVMAQLGLDYDGATLTNPRVIRPVPALPLPAFERTFTEPLPLYIQAHNVAPDNRVVLRLQRTDRHLETDMGVVGPRGGVVLGAPYIFANNPISHQLQWRLDPFRFFAEALGTDGLPRPDVTTRNGRRMAFAHVDGDGFANVANLPGRPLAAEVVRDRLVRPAWLPTSVSVIAREIVGNPRHEAIARSLFALPQVEGASHSYTHPFDWTRTSTAREGAYSDQSAATTYGDPNARGVRPLTPQHEIDDSFRYIQSLMPPGKTTRLMLWSGATNPTADYLRRTHDLGFANMNGGDAQIHRYFPSYANLAPVGRYVGGYWQIFTGCANENLFTNLWTGPFDGQSEAVRTFAFQEKPRRMAPINIYYHFYAGDRLGGVKALQSLYRWAEARPIAPLFASAYAYAAQGFFTATIAQDGPGTWEIAHMGALRTVRFDAEGRMPDLGACRHVAGWNRANGALYVHLAAPEARIVLVNRVGAAPPHLQEASGALDNWAVGPREVTATFSSPTHQTVVLAGLPQVGKFRLTGGFRQENATNEALGQLRLRAAAGTQRLEVRW